MVERLVANEKVEGSSPFARSRKTMSELANKKCIPCEGNIPPFNLNIPKSCDDGKPYCFDYKDEYSLKFENIANALTKKFQS